MNNTKDIVITGASKGIGLAIAKYFHKTHKLHLIVRDPNSMPKEITESNVSLYQANLNEIESIQSALLAISNSTNKVDVIINNAGIYIEKPFSDTTPSEITELLNVNLRASGIIINELIPSLQQADAPIIINTSSSSALNAPANQAIYSASKAGLSILSESLRKELNDYSIRVTTMYLHGVNTWSDPNPRKLLHTDDVVRAIEFVVSCDTKCQVHTIEISAIQ